MDSDDSTSGCEVLISSDEPIGIDRPNLGTIKADTFGEAIEMFKKTGRGMYGGRVEAIVELIFIHDSLSEPDGWTIDYNCDQSEANAVRISLIEPSREIPDNPNHTP